VAKIAGWRARRGEGWINVAVGVSDQIRDVWMRVFEIVRRDVDTPTLWLAMQGVTPVEIQGNNFVAKLPRELEYLATNLESAESSLAIEAAINEAVGRPLAFRLLYGEALDGYVPGQALPSASPDNQLILGGAAVETESWYFKDKEVTWELLTDELRVLCKKEPLIRFPHGQARCVLECVQVISEAIDILMPKRAMSARDEHERHLARTIERLGSVINLDPIFISLELWRYRHARGKDIGIRSPR
jgi:hypothetical protein